MASRADSLEVPDDLEEKLKSVKWRINNLYKIVDMNGRVVRFAPNGPQQQFLDNIHTKNLILKARQLGFSTFVQILMLDQCIWVPGTSVGMVAHRLPDATRIFRDKAQFAYNNLDGWIKNRVPLERISGQEMVFCNGSRFVVGVSLRSGTYRMLHISEHGKICAQWPEKAKEVKTGALPTVPQDGFIFIESTAEGQAGDFFDFCETSRNDARKNIKLTNEHYKFHFYPWWTSEEYRMDPVQAKSVDIPENMVKYFEQLDKNHGIKLTLSQKAWYVLKARTQHEEMKREMPSHADEAFEAIVEHAIYSHQLASLIEDGGIGRYKCIPGAPTYTFWDIGISDHTAIWVIQFLPKNVRRIIGYYSNHNVAMPHYLNWLQKFANETGAVYSGHVLPHDGKNRDKLTGESYERGVQRTSGVRAMSVERKDVLLGINEVRNLFPLFEIDADGAENGLRCLKAYQWDVDETTGMAKKQPKHNWASHGADALRTSAFFRPHIFNAGNTVKGV